MAIVLPEGRPAIDIVRGSYERPPEPWAHLGDPEPRANLEVAIRSVGRLEPAEPSRWPFLGTAFVVGRELVLTFSNRVDPTASPAPRVVNFGRELTADESVVVELEEPLHLDSRWGCELLRARVPASIQPLRLSVDEAVDREVALVGYPSSDARNDPALVERIFRGALDVKRLLPGRVTGTESDGQLLHDCSTTGGCIGAPLIDVATGDVVGVHYRGRALYANNAAPATELYVEFAAAGFDVMLGGTPPAAAMPPSFDSTSVTVDDEVERPAERIPSGPVTAPEDEPLPPSRPALPAQRWPEALDTDWRAVLAPHEQRIASAIRAVGKLSAGTGGNPWGGTAFLVGDRLALTASFVAQAFADGSGREVAFRSGAAPTIDFGDALAGTPADGTTTVIGIRFIHPYFHVALVELDRMPEGVAVLDLASRLPSELSGRLAVLLAFDAHGSLVIQPGQVLQVGQLPDDSGLPAVVHDCSSQAGSAGGAVIDLGTGYVIGLHSHTNAGNGGFAQPAWELARDPVLWDQAMRFRPDPRPPWLDRWKAAGAAPTAVRERQPETRAAGWTVDQVPIDWSREEPKALERLLVASIDAQMALYAAENIGFQLGTVSRTAPPVLLWREILRNAATAGLLRRLLEEFASEPQYAGIASQLRVYL